MYKWLEAVAAIYAVNKDPQLDQIMDRFIGCVVKSQRADGYIHTPVIIAELNKRLNTAASDGGDNTVVGTAVAFCIVATFYLVILLLFVLFRKKWIERPVVRFLASLLMEK